ncbi:hypothetical protein C1890_27280 [Pseudomonas sp. DP16D-R1]|nr:hypothetical protein C1890_27280 [Pseudomonas sp. DP16D-R1]
MLAMDVNENACCLDERGVLEFIASRLAPTGFLVSRKNSLARRYRAFHPDWRQAAAVAGDVQHRGLTAFQGDRF